MKNAPARATACDGALKAAEMEVGQMSKELHQALRRLMEVYKARRQRAEGRSAQQQATAQPAPAQPAPEQPAPEQPAAAPAQQEVNEQPTEDISDLVVFVSMLLVQLESVVSDVEQVCRYRLVTGVLLIALRLPDTTVGAIVFDPAYHAHYSR